MATTEDTLDALFEMDRFVRLMAVASETDGVLDAVRAYLAGWSRARVRLLQATGAGWVPFDECQQPFTVSSAAEVRQIGGSLRIRCRELRASDMRVAPELLELDLFFFFAQESLAVFEPARSRASVRFNPPNPNRFGTVSSNQPHAA